MPRISTATARWFFWGLLFAAPSACPVLLAVVTGRWIWFAAIPVVFFIAGGPGEHFFRAFIGGDDGPSAGGDTARDRT